MKSYIYIYLWRDVGGTSNFAKQIGSARKNTTTLSRWPSSSCLVACASVLAGERAVERQKRDNAEQIVGFHFNQLRQAARLELECNLSVAMARCNNLQPGNLQNCLVSTFSITSNSGTLPSFRANFLSSSNASSVFSSACHSKLIFKVTPSAQLVSASN